MTDSLTEWPLAAHRIADRLDRWADESKRGGWSTHQVEPMQKLAAEIRRAALLERPSEVLR